MTCRHLQNRFRRSAEPWSAPRLPPLPCLDAGIAEPHEEQLEEQLAVEALHIVHNQPEEVAGEDIQVGHLAEDSPSAVVAVGMEPQC